MTDGGRVVTFDDPLLQSAYEEYLAARKELDRTKPINLMDIGTLAAKVLKKRGMLEKLDESEEINACTVKIKVDIDGKLEDWLLLFKNETHNHPTEIEPFGGAATCIGGAHPRSALGPQLRLCRHACDGRGRSPRFPSAIR